MSLKEKSEDESEDETTESDEEDIHESLKGYFGHFYQNTMPMKKLNKCKSFLLKLKKAYGCTKRDSVPKVAGWKICFKKKKSFILSEEALLKFDKEKSDYRKFVMMRIFYTMLILSSLINQINNSSTNINYIR